ncbi:MAG: hypothetical protein J6Y32_08960 [Bacteroidales bacterium]|nr:hypothetical protein [Bacteroidales bacterium]
MDELIPVFNEIVFLMPKEFDAHDFILQLIKKAPISYFSILRATGNNVALANAQISNHLKNNANLYSIEFYGKTQSHDIFQEISECAKFIKTI